MDAIIPTLTYNRANIVNIKDAIIPTVTYNRANIVNIKDAIMTNPHI
jgi:predicted transcriptional regulator